MKENLDPEIPRITVTAEHDGKSYVLPYDAAFTTGESLSRKRETNRTWFAGLMDNFWSLPELGVKLTQYRGFPQRCLQ